MRTVQVKTSSRNEVRFFQLHDHANLSDLAKEAADSFGLTPGKYSFMASKGILGTSVAPNTIFPFGTRGKDVPNAQDNVLTLVSMG